MSVVVSLGQQPASGAGAVVSHGDDTFVELPAPAPIRDRVLSLWIHGTRAPIQRRVVPDGTVHVVCPVGAGPQLVDHRAVPSWHSIPAGSTVVGARLRPGATLLASAASDAGPLERAGAMQPEVERWMEALADRTRLARTGQEAVRRLATCLEALPLTQGEDSVMQSSVDALLRDPSASLDGLAADSSFSTRQWRRRFVRRVGVGPKKLQQVLRFQLVLERVHADLRHAGVQAGSLADLAVHAGYADQSHLSHACRRLTGLPPRSFISQTIARCGAHHDHTAAFAPR